MPDKDSAAVNHYGGKMLNLTVVLQLIDVNDEKVALSRCGQWRSMEYSDTLMTGRGSPPHHHCLRLMQASCRVRL